MLQEKGLIVKKTKYSSLGIQFTSDKKSNFTNLNLYKNGFFDIQDEGSQLVGLRVKAQPNQIILDYCAGSGGKTLTFAPFMKNSGQIFLHDKRENILLEAKKRLKRAGIQNYQICKNKEELLVKIGKKCDWVVLDVPCSGTGTLRRNPENKYKFNMDYLSKLRETQEDILSEALLYVKPDTGKIVYITCSLLYEENLAQITKFCEKYNWIVENNEIFETLPKSNGMDGFFSATLIPSSKGKKILTLNNSKLI